MSRKALILGVSGQDGATLAADLLRDGWKIYGGSRRGHIGKLWRLEELGILDRVELVNINLHEPFQIMEGISTLQPDHIYHFAGESFAADSFQQPRTVIETNLMGTLNVLEATRVGAPKAKLFFASSAEVYGVAPESGICDENTSARPVNPYGVSKLAAQQLMQIYRTRGLHAVCGIMFNHEGPLRARNFVTRKITYNLARLRLDGGAPMQLGDMGSGRDWGSAADYVGVMPKALDLDTPEDFVFATGKKTLVREFLECAATAAGFAPVFDGEGVNTTCRDRTSNMILAQVSPKYFRPFDTAPLIGNPARLKNRTGFAGSRDVAAIAEAMVAADLDRRKNGSTNV